MALLITGIARENGATCDHIRVEVNDEGTTRTFRTSFQEIDALLGEMTAVEQKRMLVLLWAKYRRSQGRPVTATVIA